MLVIYCVIIYFWNQNPSQINNMERKSILQVTILLSFMFLMFACNSNKQSQKKHNEDAIVLLQKVGEAVHSSEKKSFTLTVEDQKPNDDGEIQTAHNVCSVKAIFPNKLFVDGNKGDKKFSYWYDGEYFTYYSKTENNYVTLEAPATTAAMIDTMHSRFGFRFPAGDFFYPSFKKDIEDFFNNIDLGGKETIGGEACTKVIAQNSEININIWVSDATSLPIKFNILNKKEKGLKYEAVFSNWNLTPTLSNADFDFVAPENARSINIMSKK